MLARELSTAQVAQKSSVAPKTINNILAGRHASQIDILVKIANAIGVEFWTLWLPDPPADAKNDRLLQSLVELGSQLSGDALGRITRMAELELNAERAALKLRPKGSNPSIQPKSE
jgi:transcriptional regulator with XRE-family HTH domain